MQQHSWEKSENMRVCVETYLCFANIEKLFSKTIYRVSCLNERFDELS